MDASLLGYMMEGWVRDEDEGGYRWRGPWGVGYLLVKPDFRRFQGSEKMMDSVAFVRL